MPDVWKVCLLFGCGKNIRYKSGNRHSVRIDKGHDTTLRTSCVLTLFSSLISLSQPSRSEQSSLFDKVLTLRLGSSITDEL